MLNEYPITLNTCGISIGQTIHMVAGDTGRRIRARISDMDVDSETEASFHATLQDGTRFTNNATFDNGCFIVDPTEAIQNGGKLECQLDVSGVRTRSFFIDVENALSDSLNSREITGDSSALDFESESVYPLESLIVELDPIQDLRGYEKPWPAGGGKNILPAPSTWITGKTLNNATGAERDLANAALTDYIPARITANNPYYLSGLGYADTDLYYRTYAAAYNANKEFLGRTGGVYYAEYPLTVSSFSSGTPQGTGNIAFIRITIYPVTGNTVTIEDILPLIENTAQLELGTAATTYEPYSNVCPITGTEEVTVTKVGKNLLPRTTSGTKTENGVTFVVNDDGSVTMNGTATANPSLRYTLNAPVKLDGEYIVSGLNGGSNTTWCFQYKTVDKDGTVSGWIYVNQNEQRRTFNGVESISDFRVVVFNGTTVDNVTVYPMIRKADDADPTYEPYIDETVTIDLGRTVYGGTLDIVSGVLTVTHKSVTPPSSDYANNGTTGTLYEFSLNNLTDKAAGSTNFICSNMMVSTNRAEYSARGRDTGQTISFCLPTSVANNITSARAWVDSNPIQTVYELATPETYQLTPAQIVTLLGKNYIWTDSGKIIKVKTFGARS